MGRSWSCLAGLLMGMAGLLSAGEFAPPADGPVAFRRDRIPLEPAAMVALSRDLELLAGGLDAKTAADRRVAAQMLALALALDPGNANARKRIAEYQNDRHHPDVQAGQLEAGRMRIRQSVMWLETPDAGKDAQALADCLKDVLAISAPALPKTEGAGVVAERGAWAGWIPAVSEYERKAVVVEDTGGQPANAGEPEARKVLLTKAEVLTPMWRRIGTGPSTEWVLAPSLLEMSATELKGDDGKKGQFRIVIGPRPGLGGMARLGKSLESLLRKTHGSLPQGVQITINSREFERSIRSGRRQSISAAAAVLASSAITGREPDAIIIGQIGEDGAYTLPERFWYQLQALGKGTGQRLVLPAEAAAFMPSILAMEKPEFFFEYEVLLAKDFEQLLALTAKTPDEPLASATAKFREIRERKGKAGLRTYIDNGFVKQRLAGVLQDMPSQVSAKMLLMQASGNRPAWVSRQVLAAELRRALETVPAIRTPQQLDEESKQLPNVGEIYESCRAKLDGLERYAEKADRDLVEEARAVTVAIRSLEKATRSRDYTYGIRFAVQSAHAELKRLYEELDEKLARETGDEKAAGSQ